MPKERSRLRNTCELLAFQSVRAPVGLLGPAAAERLGRFLGRAGYLVAGSRRRRAVENISRAFPELGPRDTRELARNVFTHFGGMASEIVSVLAEPLEDLRRRVEVVGEQIARSAVGTGRGVMFLTSHMGNWEYAALITAGYAGPLTVITRPLDNPLLERLLRAFREQGGNRVLPKADSIRQVLRVLRAGGSIGVLIDQHAHPPDAVNVPFFGRPAATASSVARLADRTEALVVPTRALRVGPARYRLTYEDPIDVRSLSAEERRPEALTALLSAVLERHVRMAPEQWLWLHNRWRLD